MKTELAPLVFHLSFTWPGAGQAAVPATVITCRSGSFDRYLSYLCPAASVCRAVLYSENSEHWRRAPKSCTEPHWLKLVRIGLGRSRIERTATFSHSHLVQLHPFNLGYPKQSQSQ